MEILIVSLAAFLTAILTFFSGFGLGTILSPVFMVFFPAELAIALTGIVHFSNNLFKFFLVGKKINKEILIRFGIPGFVFSLLGSLVLVQLKDLEPFFSYSIGEKKLFISPLKFTIAILLFLFVILETIPKFQNLSFEKDKLSLGGALSGFFGGLSGHQGALRSAFLIKSGLSKEEFISTSIVIACIVDLARLGIYTKNILAVQWENQIFLISMAVFSAILGAYTGNQLLTKITLEWIQRLVTIMLFIIAFLLGMGII